MNGSKRPTDTAARDRGPLLVVSGLDVYYGRAHALQSVSFTLDHGVLGIVGRNGMGKTTLCHAITGLVKASGSIKFFGEEIIGLSAHEITRRGIAYVPQGRRVWPSLTVDETLRLVAHKRRDIERIYTMFPRLAERKGHGGAQLSGGEQQMLAIGRALLLRPILLVMDEPTEGLAPVIVAQVTQALRVLAAEDGIAILLIEQNLGVALEVSDRIGVMVNGRIAQQLPAAELAQDRLLQERLLGLRSGAMEEESQESNVQHSGLTTSVLIVKRAHGSSIPIHNPGPTATVLGYNRWNSGVVDASQTDIVRAVKHQSSALSEQAAKTEVQPASFTVADSSRQAAYVAGTFDTKSRELFFIRQCLEKLGLRVITVDLSTSGKASLAQIHPREVARYHPMSESAVFSQDRGTAVSAMAQAFEIFIKSRADLSGIISAGGSGGTSLATSGMRVLPIGIPKVMLSTMASGDTRPYVGPSDICMMYSVTDIQGINRISEKVLSNAAHALAGMIRNPPIESSVVKPALGLTMFGVTTPCVQAVVKRLESEYDCLVFHATGVGGQSMEKLVDSGLLQGVIDVSTTEVADEICGGTLSAGATRLDVFAQHKLPYVGSCGALDMANFGVWDSVPERFKGRNLYRHNPTVTLMRTNTEENQRIGEFIALKLNAMQGPLSFLIPEQGVSSLDRIGQQFYDPAANRTLFSAIENNFKPSRGRSLKRLPMHINDQEFADALVGAWLEISQSGNPSSYLQH
jgi:uncharacterized protein (UPF0261 family)/ABC-type branched-subunit amino acid transport system ATPase component